MLNRVIQKRMKSRNWTGISAHFWNRMQNDEALKALTTYQTCLHRSWKKNSILWTKITLKWQNPSVPMLSCQTSNICNDNTDDSFGSSYIMVLFQLLFIETLRGQGLYLLFFEYAWVFVLYWIYLQNIFSQYLLHLHIMTRTQLSIINLIMMMMSWCLMSSDVIWHIRDKLWPMPKHGSIKSTYVRCMRV